MTFLEIFEGTYKKYCGCESSHSRRVDIILLWSCYDRAGYISSKTTPEGIIRGTYCYYQVFSVDLAFGMRCISGFTLFVALLYSSHLMMLERLCFVKSCCHLYVNIHMYYY